MTFAKRVTWVKLGVFPWCCWIKMKPAVRGLGNCMQLSREESACLSLCGSLAIECDVHSGAR